MDCILYIQYSTAFIGTCTFSCQLVHVMCLWEVLSSVFYQFLDSARVASIHSLIHTDYARLVPIFQGTVKTVASRHKCGDILQKKTICDFSPSH
jgi:hypothetical protein